jgi:hypothetical protein
MRIGALAMAGLIALGCGGGRDNPDNTAWETRKGFQSVGTDESGEVETGGSRSVLHDSMQGWVGVRHDLGLNPSKKPASSCACLGVSVGGPDDDAFIWRGARPDVNPSFVALAITAAVPECPGGPANASDRRASISAIDRKGKDVFVEVEDLPADRPIASGAIIHPLEPGGHVYVRPRNKKIPYAKISGKELCRVK